MKRQNLRTVSLIIVTLTYLLAGAAIFGYLESDYETRQREALELMELIVKRKYNISEDDFMVLTTTVIKSVPHKAGIQWRFPGAFYFATTVVTTIGYGHSTPATLAGRSFCMIYALIGIPLGLVMFQSIGERLNTFVGTALHCAKRCLKAKNPEVTQTNLVMVVLVLSTILMTSMAAVFAKYERWDYFDALYYCFITLTTIGFGDYVALQKESALQSKPEYVALSLIFILFGLSVVSSAVNLLVLKFLTLNTEDERRDERLRYKASRNPIQLEGDVIMLPAATSASKQGGAASAGGAHQKHQLERSLDGSPSTGSLVLRHRFGGGGGRGSSSGKRHQKCSTDEFMSQSQESLSLVGAELARNNHNNNINTRYSYDKDVDEEMEDHCSCSLGSSSTTATTQPAPKPVPPSHCIQCLLLASSNGSQRVHFPGRHRTGPIGKLSHSSSSHHQSHQHHHHHNQRKRIHHASTRSYNNARGLTSFGARSHTLHNSPLRNPLPQLTMYPATSSNQQLDDRCLGPVFAASSARLARSQPQVARLVCRCCCQEPECAQQALKQSHMEPEAELEPSFSFIDNTPIHQPQQSSTIPTQLATTTAQERTQIFSVDPSSTNQLRPLHKEQSLDGNC